MAVAEPSGLPPWQAEHESQPESVYAADIQRSTGEPRRRRVFTIAPRRVQVQRRLSNAQAAVWREWYEDDLQAGSLEFTTVVGGEAGGAQSITAQIPPGDMPQWQAQDHGSAWLLRVTLLAVG